MPEHLTEHHRLVSQQKRAAVLHATDVMIDQGVAFHWKTLTQRARVSVKFNKVCRAALVPVPTYRRADSTRLRDDAAD